MTSTVAIILAAGKGTRMASDLPKVLHEFAGEPLVLYPIRAARAAGAEHVVVVVGYKGDRVREVVTQAFADADADSWLHFATQAEQLGTGHAVLCGLPPLEGRDGVAMILSGDVPLLHGETLRGLVERCEQVPSGVVLTSFTPPDPTGYGRIVRDDAGQVQGIVEQRDANEAQQAIGECNAGTYAVRLEHLRADLPKLGRDNAQGEIYLTDVVALATARGEVAGVEIDPVEAAGINTVEQLRALEQHAAKR